jgi:hypothetical protein
MEKLLELIDKKIEEIENYAIDTQENEERYIHEINCLMETKFLLQEPVESF